MRLPALASCCAIIAGCTGTEPVPQPLDGVWHLSVAHCWCDPRTLALTQRDSAVTGTGAAMGVDVPVGVAVRGAAALPAVVLTFDYGGATARYTATLQSDSILIGEAVYDASFGVRSDSLTYVRR